MLMSPRPGQSRVMCAVARTWNNAQLQGRPGAYRRCVVTRAAAGMRLLMRRAVPNQAGRDGRTVQVRGDATALPCVSNCCTCASIEPTEKAHRNLCRAKATPSLPCTIAHRLAPIPAVRDSYGANTHRPACHSITSDDRGIQIGASNERGGT